MTAKELNHWQAQGRVIAAGRMLAGLDQTQLGEKAGVSATTISNIERGVTESRPETVKKVRTALRKEGINLAFNMGTGLLMVATTYAGPDDEDDI